MKQCRRRRKQTTQTREVKLAADVRGVGRCVLYPRFRDMIEDAREISNAHDTRLDLLQVRDERVAQQRCRQLLCETCDVRWAQPRQAPSEGAELLTDLLDAR